MIGLGGDRWRSRCWRAFLRLWDLGKPRPFLFDETYYAKDAWSLLHTATSLTYVEKANERDPRRADHRTSGPDAPNMVVHPEVGKWLIGARRAASSGWTRSAGGSPRRSSAR